MSSKQNSSGASASKKIRMTMACERCRSKKVKCDFAHPQCSRCQQAKVDCSYDGSSTQIDLFSLVKLNETVDLLQKKVQSIESDMKDVCSNTQFVANKVRMNDTNDIPTASNRPAADSEQAEPSAKRKHTDLIPTSSNTQWSLSLTPKGLRIDTNIVSLHDLYDILLSGVSQFDLTTGNCIHDPVDTSSQSSVSTSTPAPESPNIEHTTIKRKKPLWKSRLKTHPLYSTWEPEGKREKNAPVEHSRDFHDSKTTFKTDLLSDETFYKLISVFEECFLCLPCSNPSISIATRYKNGTLDPLLANSVLAWTSRHTAIYHNLFPGRDPNQVGEVFFLKAKELIKERFMKTSVDTMFSLLIMYIYTIGIPSENKAEVESEAYIYLGLAIRMCLDLKMNLESTSTDPYEQEKNRRFFWVLYFLETLSAIHSDKSFTLPPKNMITVKFPTLMEHELSGETRYRVEFIIQRFKITRIYRSIISKTTEEKPLFSQISAIDKELKSWYTELPSYFKYEPGDIHKRRWDSESFKEQACIKLNFEYNFQLCQLYGIFFSKTADDQASTIEILSRDTCLKAAQTTVELLECWVQLKQLWCHFSLENLMATTIIYSYVIEQPKEDGEREIAQKNLEKMAKILISSPVRHHKYVLTLVSKIKSILQDADVSFDVPEEDTKVQQQQQQQQQPQQATQVAQPQQPIQPISLTNQYNSRRGPFTDVLDVASASSAFDIIKTNSFSEDMHFSDFVYNPTLLGFNDNLLQYMYNGSIQPNNNDPLHPPPPPIATGSTQGSPSIASNNSPKRPNMMSSPVYSRPPPSSWAPSQPVMLNPPSDDRPYHLPQFQDRTTSSSPNPHPPSSSYYNNNNNPSYYYQ